MNYYNSTWSNLPSSKFGR